MKDLQEQIRLFCLHHGMIAPSEHRLLDIMSELGEVAKEILKGSNYGEKELEQTDELSGELGDLLFAIVQLANNHNINLEEALKKVMKKYQNRIDKSGSAGSGR